MLSGYRSGSGAAAIEMPLADVSSGVACLIEVVREGLEIGRQWDAVSEASSTRRV